MNISLIFANALSGCSMLALAALGFSSQAQAFTISGKADGVWSDPILESGNICLKNPSHPECSTMIQGVGKDTFSWGTVAKSSSTKKANELQFTGTDFSSDLGRWFKIGTLKYFNGLIYSDTNAKNVTLNLNLSFGNQNPVDKLIPITLNLINTPNIGNIKDIANADRVEFPTSIPTTSFKYNLDTYQIDIRPFSTSFFESQTSISAIEEEYTNDPGNIYAKVIQGPPPDREPPISSVPEPSTIAGSCLAGIYLAYRKKLSKQKAKSSCG
jgi:hypothetical protein